MCSGSVKALYNLEFSMTLDIDYNSFILKVF